MTDIADIDIELGRILFIITNNSYFIDITICYMTLMIISILLEMSKSDWNN
jgi:hypothetical protein